MIASADSFDEIRASIERIAAEVREMCPMKNNLMLHTCLRSSTRCSDQCLYVADWIGPDAS